MNKEFTIKCMIPKKLIEIADDMFTRSEPKNNLIKMYAVIKYHYEKELKRNKRRSNPKFESLIFAPLSSSYFEKVICDRYIRYKKILINEGYISSKMKFKVDVGGDLFEDHSCETYTVDVVSKSFRTNVDSSDSLVEMEIKLMATQSIAAEKNANFLMTIGIVVPNITYDKYGYRLYHDIFTTYKEVLPTKGNFVYYDIIASVPHFLLQKMKEKNIMDDPFYALFNGDFYLNFANELNIIGDKKTIRDKAKKIFLYLSNGSKKMNPGIRKIIKNKFPRLNYWFNKRDIGKILIAAETEYMMKMVVPSLDVDEVLTIFDGFIVWKEDETVADKFIQKLMSRNSSSSIKFSKQYIKLIDEEEDDNAIIS